MCRSCWDEAGQPAIDTPEVRRAVRLIEDVFHESGVGGKLHIVIDDWNVEQEHLDFCAGRVVTEAERRCHGALNELSEAERMSALALHGGFLVLTPC